MTSRFHLRFLLLTGILLSTYACEPDTVDPSVSRDDFLGSWTGNSSGTVNGPLGFQMVITASNSSPDGILMDNFDAVGLGQKVLAVVDGGNITIPLNIINGDSILGSGILRSDGKLSFEFTVSDGQTVDERTATATR
ncbi:MAG: hypothetical protein ACKO1U_05570 [Bacteroidota bacterium]